MTVQRWKFHMDHRYACECDGVPDNSGSYVLYRDYTALSDEMERILANNVRLQAESAAQLSLLKEIRRDIERRDRQRLPDEDGSINPVLYRELCSATDGGSDESG